MADETRDIAITANQLAQNANVHGAINGILVENLVHVLKANGTLSDDDVDLIFRAALETLKQEASSISDTTVFDEMIQLLFQIADNHDVALRQ